MSCVYCGVREATTEDHVIPRGLFDAAPPEGYIKIPACHECNNGHSRDEEYFVATVTAEGDFYASAAARRVIERIGQKHQSGKRAMTGLAKRLISSMEPVAVHSESGNFLGTQPAFRLEVDRVNRVLRKMVRGLFFHEFGRRLPVGDGQLWVEIKPDPKLLDKPPLAWVRSNLAPPAKVLGDVFVYRYFALNDAPDTTAWLLGFYDSVPAAALSLVPPAGATVPFSP